MSLSPSWERCPVCAVQIDAGCDCPLCMVCGRHASLFRGENSYCSTCADPCLSFGEAVGKGERLCEPCALDALEHHDTIPAPPLEGAC